jgi:hypothetical protein
MSLKTFEFPKEVPVEKAAAAWGLKPGELNRFSDGDTLSSHEIRKFLMKTTDVIIHGKTNNSLKEYFVRFMVLSLKYPLIEDTEKAILEMLGRDYLKAEDAAALRKKCAEFKNSFDRNKHGKYILEYYEKSKEEYIAQFPKRVLLDSLREVPAGTPLQAQSKISRQMSLNLAICATKMGETIGLIPVVEEISREIIDSNPLMTSLKPVIGSLRMRRQVADLHTNLAVGG